MRVIFVVLFPTCSIVSIDEFRMTDRSFTPQNNLERKGTDQPGLTAESVTGKLIHRGRT